MAIAPRPSDTLFAAAALPGEVVSFPDWARGWGLTFDPGQTGGVPPMEWFNSTYKTLNEGILYNTQTGIAPWSATTDYPLNAYTSYNGVMYQAKANSKNITPGTNEAYWGPVVFSGVTTGAFSAATIISNGNVTAGGVFNSNSSTQNSVTGNHDWSQAVFHSYAQGSPLDSKTAWILGASTQYSSGYAMISKIGIARGWMWDNDFVFQHTGEGNHPAGVFKMGSDGTFRTAKISLDKDIDTQISSDNYSILSFRRKQAQVDRKVLGSITWDSYRDASDPSNVAAIWAEGAGTSANWGEILMGARVNGVAGLPTPTFRLTADKLFLENVETQSIYSKATKSSDTNLARYTQELDFDGVSTHLRWKNYGSKHVIFDASAGKAPDGRTCNVKDAEIPWSQIPNTPTLMGHADAGATYGVRVDSARQADVLGTYCSAVTNGLQVQGAQPMVEWHKVGVKAYMSYININNDLIIAETGGNGEQRGQNLYTFAQNGSFGAVAGLWSNGDVVAYAGVPAKEVTYPHTTRVALSPDGFGLVDIIEKMAEEIAKLSAKVAKLEAK